MPRALTSITKMDSVVRGLNLLVEKNKNNQPNTPLPQLWSGDVVPGEGRGSLAAFFQHWQVVVWAALPNFGFGPLPSLGGRCQGCSDRTLEVPGLGTARGGIWEVRSVAPLRSHLALDTCVTMSPLLSLVISF